MVGPGDELLNCLHMIVICQSLLKFPQFGRIRLKGIITKAVFLDLRTMWYPYRGFFEGVIQTRASSTNRARREAAFFASSFRELRLNK